MPVEVMEYLNKFGLAGGFVGIGWALYAGKLYFRREVDFIRDRDAEVIDDLRHQLGRANQELGELRGLMNKIVDQALRDRTNT